jgi:hypothetical protein
MGSLPILANELVVPLISLLALLGAHQLSPPLDRLVDLVLEPLAFDLTDGF